MASILTKSYRVFLAKEFRNALNANTGDTALYVFCGRPQTWVDASNVSVSDTNPPVPQATVQQTTFEYWRDMLAIKKVNQANTALVIPRRDWTSNTVYAQFDDTDATLATKAYYVLDTSTSPFRVYKCLWNNLGAASTTPPSTIGSNPAPTATSDSYVWQYMYSIQTGDFVFLTNSWMPVFTDTTVQNNAVTNSGKLPTAVPLIVTSGGSAYNASVNTVVTIIGDGSGATAANTNVTIVGGAVSSVVLSTGGSGYSMVDSINVYQSGASAATVRAIIPPYPNHGYDPVTELGTAAVMCSIQFVQDESGKLTVLNDYRRVGVLINPQDANGAVCNATFYKQTYDLTLSANTGTLNPDDLIYNKTNASAPTAIVVDVVRNAGNTAWVARLTYVDDKGTAAPFQTNDVIKCNVSSVEATVSSVSDPELTFFSGNIVYADQRIPTLRSSDQTEDIKLVFQLA
jgi:hypothetical protein